MLADMTSSRAGSLPQLDLFCVSWLCGGCQAVIAGKPAPTGFVVVSGSDGVFTGVIAGKPAPTGFVVVSGSDGVFTGAIAGRPAPTF